MIGSFGDITFESNSSRILTINDFNMSEGARWQKHEVNNVAERSEFLGNSASSVTLKVGLKASLGVNPTLHYKRFQALKKVGAVESLLLGTEVIGKFYIVGLDHEKKYIDNFGNVWDIVLTIKLSEYCEETLEEVKKTNNTYKQNKKGKLDYKTGQVS